MFMFGLVTLLQGLTQGYGGLLTTRFFLGVFEVSSVEVVILHIGGL
jgi:hypothetical protein